MAIVLGKPCTSRLGGLLTSSTFLSQPNPTPTKGALTESCVPPWCEPCLQPNLPSRCEFTPAQLSSSRLASSQKSVILQHSSSKLLVYYYVYYICTRLCEYFVLSSHHERAARYATAPAIWLPPLLLLHHFCCCCSGAAVPWCDVVCRCFRNPEWRLTFKTQPHTLSVGTEHRIPKQKSSHFGEPY